MNNSVALGLASRWLPCLFVALLAQAAHATDPPYLEQLPAATQVLADYAVADRADALARQEAALRQLSQAVELIQQAREYCCATPDEERVRNEYNAAARDVHSEALATFSTANPDNRWNPWAKSPRDQWRAQQGGYERDPTFRAAAYDRYIPAEVRPVLDAAYADSQERFYGGVASSDSSSDASPYDQLGAVGQAAVQLVYYGLLLWLVLIVVRELMPFGSRRGNPLLVAAGFRLYRLHWATGTVTDYQSWTETVKRTTTEDDPYGNTRTTFFQRTYFHETFTLTSSRSQHHVHVSDAKIYPTIGHVFTAVWAIRRWRKAGHYVLFFDRTSAKTQAIEITVRWLLSLRLVMFIPVLALAALGGWAATLLLEPAPNDEPAVLFGTIIVTMIVAAFLFVRTNKRRGRRFIERDAPRVLAAIEKAEPPDAGSLMSQAPA
jgi:hypothetical protein